jgi:hypothetical protein
MRRNTTVLLVAVNVLLACLLAWLWIEPQGGLRNVHWQPPAPIKPDLGGSLAAASLGRDDADVARFMAILDRPVFSPTRRPPPPPKTVAVAAVQADPLAGVHLYGLFSGSDGGGVIARVDGKTQRVKISETIGDWSLKEIRASEVVFSRGAETRVVPLLQAKQAAGAAALPPAIAAPGAPASVPPPARPSRSPDRASPAAPAGAPVGAPPAQPATPAAAPGANPAASPRQSNPFVIGGSR